MLIPASDEMIDSVLAPTNNVIENNESPQKESKINIIENIILQNANINTETDDTVLPLVPPIIVKSSEVSNIHEENEKTLGSTSARTENTIRSKNKNYIDRVIVKFGQLIEKPANEIEHLTNTRPWTKKNMCPYCMKEVTHFPRHLQRNHAGEGAVQELLQLDAKDPKRKDLLSLMRRQGNYINKEKSQIIRPVRRPKDKSGKQRDNKKESNNDEEEKPYVVCDYCLGFYKKNYLRRHRKTCHLRPSKSAARENHLSEAQLAIMCSGVYKEFYDSLRLKNEVFIIMRADEISKVAMADVLICSYAESLLQKHKRTQIRNAISNKMRELGRFMITMRDMTAATNLIDVLKPEMFSNIVAATKIIAKYDPETKTFKASSLALHMGTTLKQVCNIATKMIIQKNRFLQIKTDRKILLKEIKLLLQLVTDHWTSEIASLALKDLNEKKWIKPKLLPLTNDIVTFEKYVTKIAKESCEQIAAKQQVKKAFKKLTECVLALTLLLNRKRIGEVQYLKVTTYLKEVPQNQQEEFLQSLSEGEKLLTKEFKRVVTDGKGSKPVAVLFPKTIQNYINIMLAVRPECVQSTNTYLFANPSTKDKWLSGYHIIKKLAHESGVTSQDLFTSTRLRKQIATVLQVLNVNDAEIEQFARFMGHTKKTHEEFYRLTQDVYQTAKVSKLLMAINKGKGAEYKGKTLDEIEFSDSVESEDSDSDSDSELKSHLKKRARSVASRKREEGSEGAATSENQVDTENTEENTIQKSVQSKCPYDFDDYNVDDLPIVDMMIPSSAVPDTSLKKMKNKDEISEATRLIIKDKDRFKKDARERWSAEQKKLMIHYFKEHIKHKKSPRKKEVEDFKKKNSKLFEEKTWVIIKAFIYNFYRNK